MQNPCGNPRQSCAFFLAASRHHRPGANADTVGDFHASDNLGSYSNIHVISDHRCLFSLAVVPLTCPAKNKPLMIFDSNECLSWVGSK